jgi:hypothetical protein
MPFADIPEPSIYLLIGAGLLLLGTFRRKRPVEQECVQPTEGSAAKAIANSLSS